MRIDSYPRPPHDTGIGFHYATGSARYGSDALDFWLPQLKELGASWLVLPSSLSKPVEDQFVAELVAHDIEPILWIREQPIAPLDGTSLRTVLRRFASLGAHYAYVYREPNNVESWTASDWSRPDLVDRFMKLLLPCLEHIVDADLYPVLTPLCPGGHYWDTTFLDAALDWIVQRGKQQIFDRTAIGMHNFASNRPLDWGQGGRKRWPSARPYACPTGSQDHRGFRLFEWYDEIVQSRVGHSLPLIATENGLVIGTRNHRDYPAVDEDTHARQVVQMVRDVMNAEVPDYVFNNAFWALECGEDEPFEGHAWYRRSGYRLAVVDALKALPKHSRRQPSGKQARGPRNGKPISHYLLLPDGWRESGSSRGEVTPSLQDLIPVVVAHRLTFGFRLEEARQAKRVTLLGGTDAIPSRVEADLRMSGCEVTRVAPSDPRVGTDWLLLQALGDSDGLDDDPLGG